MDKIPCAVLGATGLVGRRFVRLLADHPLFRIAVVTASERSAGSTYDRAVGLEAGIPDLRRIGRLPLQIHRPADLLKAGIRVVFSALPSEAAGPLETELAEGGAAVFSNASAHRRDVEVPILVPEVNSNHLELIHPRFRNRPGYIVTGSNCSVAGLALVLAPLRRFGLRRIVVSTCQAVSGAGRRGLASFDILGNIIPHIQGEEEKLEWEIRKILGRPEGRAIRPADFEIQAVCCRVPVRDGHLENVVIDLNEEIEPAEAVKAMKDFPGFPRSLNLPSAPRRPLILRSEPERPQPVLDAGAGKPARAAGMAVTVGPLRKKGRSLCFSFLVHNIVRGAAGNCLLTAELAAARGLLPLNAAPELSSPKEGSYESL